jgi:5-methyltetrahydrofolate--homocysteine methyltransferase
MKRAGFLARLADGPMLCDGAMGTQLMARGLAPGACGEQWNVTRSADVEAIHSAYVQAGCDLLITNTFGGTRSSLLRHGLDTQVTALNRAGAQAARRAAAGKALVLGDVGPFGGFLEPVGDTSPGELSAIYAEQIDGLRQGGADGIIVETMADPEEVAIAVRAARQAGDWPVIATYSFSQADGVFRTIMGTSAAEAVQAAIDAGADVVGTNCGTGLDLPDYVHLAEQLVAAAGATPVIVQPNAGSPQMVQGSAQYRATPQDMARIVGLLLGAGARIIGGCCGTTPEHLAAMARALRA